MASSSGISSNSSGLPNNSGSEETNLQQMMDQRKKKRMVSNRESARRSRLRKKKHLDGLMAQVAQLRVSNQQILNNLNVATEQYLGVEAENAILRAQAAELSSRLQSLNDIVSFVGAENDVYSAPEPDYYGMDELGAIFNNSTSWNCLSQPAAFMAAAAAPADSGFMY